MSTLPPPVIGYAALDSMLSRQLASKLLSLSNNDPMQNMIEANTTIKPDQNADYIVRGQVAATAEIMFIGGKGLQQRWGNLTIGNNKAIIRLKSINISSVKPSFYYCDLNQPSKNWEKGVTLGSLFHCGCLDIAVHTSSLAVNVQNLKQPEINCFDIATVSSSNNISLDSKSVNIYLVISKIN